MSKESQDSSALKAGRLVCFRLPGKNVSGSFWNIGRIVSMPVKGKNEMQLVEIQPYLIPEPRRLSLPDMEWACSDPLRFDLVREAYILDFLDAQTRVDLKQNARSMLVPMTDLCPATTFCFRRALRGS